LKKKIGKNLKKIAEDLDIKGGLTFGMARHYLFNKMKHSGDYTSSEIQAITNHSDIRTTENYLSSLREEKVKNVFKKIRDDK
jgi:integrase